MNTMTQTSKVESFSPFELEPSWKRVLQNELTAPYMTDLAAFVARERAGKIPIYPPQELVFNAFFKTPYDAVKVVIIGQDPYHGQGQAHGLSFSVPKGVAQPPSLQNIFKELQTDLEITPQGHGCLTHWAEQGVMLLNATLTVQQGEPMSHHNKGWERFTDAVVHSLCERKDPVIFVLWGKNAQEKCRFLVGKKHLLLTAAHPSPFSARNGFFGCGHFSKINKILAEHGATPIDWHI
ncbi:MAG: uracil-DNA glycosylase [Parachlamydiaceae bacterium]